MSKQNLFTDADMTLFDSIQSFCKVYNDLYANHINFKPAKWWKVEQWNLKDECPLIEHCNDIFSSKRFFEVCDFINDNTYDILKELNNKYKIIITSIGTPMNISYKAQFLEEKLPFVKDYVLLVNNGCKMSKSIVQMQNAVFIDDVASNLESSNAELKICFGDTYEWNASWDGIRCANWTDIRNLLL